MAAARTAATTTAPEQTQDFVAVTVVAGPYESAANGRMRQTHSQGGPRFLKICSDRAAELELWSPPGVTCLITPIDHGWVRRYRNHDGHLLEISQARTAG